MPPRLRPPSLQHYRTRHVHLSRRSQSSASPTTTTPAATSPPPVRVAIIGAGPAGFWTAERLFKLQPHTTVDMYERLPVPFGLVRYGVAPDHPEVRNCIDIFRRVAEHDGFAFRGGVNVGLAAAKAATVEVPGAELSEDTAIAAKAAAGAAKSVVETRGDASPDVTLAQLAPLYDAVVVAVGANRDRRLGLPGEDLPGVYSARDFVGWYTGLPWCADLEPAIPRDGPVVIVGQGNVAMDCARILLSDVDRLRKTDMPEYALQALSGRRVSEVVCVGRRGPIQARYTIKELRELITLPNAHFNGVSHDFFPTDLKTLPRPQRRIAELILKHSPHIKNIDEAISSSKSLNSTSLTKPSISLSYLLSPTQFVPTTTTQRTLTAVHFQPTTFPTSAHRFDANAQVVSDHDQDRVIELPAQMALRATGYVPDPLPPNLPNVLGVGWARTGGRGVLAGTMDDAFQVAEEVVEAVARKRRSSSGTGGGSGVAKGGWEEARKILEGKRIVGWADWLAIDELERERGQKFGKEREKVTSVAEMMQLLDQ